MKGTSLKLDPQANIRLYSYLFRIELYIQGAKTANRSILLPFLVKVYAKAKLLQKEGRKEEPTPLEQVEIGKARKRILEVVRATETHIALSCIAMGILQCLSISFAGKVRNLLGFTGFLVLQTFYSQVYKKSLRCGRTISGY